MKKVKKLLSGVTTVSLIRNGQLSILTKLKRKKLKDLTKTSACMSIDHSTSFQDSQFTELLNATVLTISGSEDTERM